MEWFNRYQLFLFDLDGLLVDTEHLHYQAYLNICDHRGFHLNWTFQRYFDAANHPQTPLRDQIYAELPELYLQEPQWSVLYEEKRKNITQLLESAPIPLMPGVEKFLQGLEEVQATRCIVTHSSLHLVQLIRKKNPILDSISHWITREDCPHPKPHPQCYQTAIEKFSKTSRKVIGFEDSARGLKALIQTQAQPVLICLHPSKELNHLLHNTPSIKYYPDFNAIQEDNAP